MKLLIIDDDALVCASLKTILETDPQVKVVGTGGSGREAVSLYRRLRPDVLLMDESTSALDPISTSKIEDLAVELKSKYTVIMVTHNMQQAARVSDNTAFFLLGDLVEYGKTEVLFSTPTDKRTEDYITGRFG